MYSKTEIDLRSNVDPSVSALNAQPHDTRSNVDLSRLGDCPIKHETVSEWLNKIAMKVKG